MRRAALHNLGCKVNSYETEAMKELLQAAGYEIVDFEDKADVYVINTCSVTNVADKKSRQMLHRARTRNPQAVVVAAGCYVQAAGEKLKEDGAVDLIVGFLCWKNILQEESIRMESSIFLPSRNMSLSILQLRRSIQELLLKFRMAAISSAATASFPIPEAGSAAAAWRMWKRK